MEFKFVALGTREYKQGLLVREELFFKGFPNASELLNDDNEEESIHLVAIHNKEIIGTGRLTIVDDMAIISQMTVLPNWQREKVGSKLLRLLLDKAQMLDCTIIELSARITALGFYKKYKFTTKGDVYSSKKTRIPHQKMILKLSV